MARMALPCLERFDPDVPHPFKIPAKLINEGPDLSKFLVSEGYQDILTFLGQLNRSMFPLKTNAAPESFPLGCFQGSFSNTVMGIRELLQQLDAFIEQAPPDPGPRRFGNISFRRWFALAEDNAKPLLEKHLPEAVRSFKQDTSVSSVDELRPYLLGGFGSAQRLDYGTGHELSFVAFLGGVWKLGGFQDVSKEASERQIVIGVVQPYLALIRKLIQTYNLEPAGTHGVWGLDDHSFVPYIFGSAQYGPAILEHDPSPTEGSLSGAPDPGDVAKADKVQDLREDNFYFGAIGFIYDVKKGPFWEHSPTLYDISGVKAGWGKINKGMMKMYNAEVLSKFPVVQHFPLGSLFKWDRSPAAIERKPDLHARSQPQREGEISEGSVAGPIEVTSTVHGSQAGLTRAPWAHPNTGRGPLVTASRMPPPRIASGGGQTAGTQAPWARPSGASASGDSFRNSLPSLPASRESPGRSSDALRRIPERGEHEATHQAFPSAPPR